MPARHDVRHARRLAARRLMTSVLTGGLAALLTACPPTPGDGSAGPTNPPGPRLGGVTAMSPGGTGYSPRPMSADGRYVAYLRPEASTAGGDVLLWDSSTETSRSLTSPVANDTFDETAPTISSDGSTAFFAASLAVAPGQPGSLPLLVRYATATGHHDVFAPPIAVGVTNRGVNEIAASADGSVVAVELGDSRWPSANHVVAVWTEAAGFELITDPAPLATREIWAYDLPGAAISEDGRYVVAVATIGDPLVGPVFRRLALYDRTTRTWTTIADTDPIPGLRATRDHTPNVLAVLPDGSVIFDVTSLGFTGEHAASSGVAIWDPATQAITQLVPTDTGARGFSASPDGRFIGFTGSDLITSVSPDSYGTPSVLDRVTGERTVAGGAPFTAPVAISATGRQILLSSTDTTVVGPNPPGSDGNSLFLWHRAIATAAPAG